MLKLLPSTAPRMIEIAKRNIKGVDFRIMDVRDILSLNAKFDLIMCSFCLPFLSREDTNKLIENCSNLLEKDGLLYISTMEGDESKAGFETTSFSGNSKVYFNYYKMHQLKDSLLQNCFSIEYSIGQDYREMDGSISTDLILIVKK